MNEPAVEPAVTGLTAASAPPATQAPAPIFNCPVCSQWLPPGSLACPACHAIVYADHLRGIAQAASAAEAAGEWPLARDTWRSALAWLPAGTTQFQAIAVHADQIEQRIEAAQQKKDASRATWTRRLGPLAPIVFFLAKLKTFFLLLFKLKFLLSFLGFFAVYWALFGLPFGLGFTVAILLHEMGHYLAARWRGLKVDLPVFLPGFGAYVRWYSNGVSLEDLSSIALAGPFAGLLVSIGFGAASLFSPAGKQQDLFSALAHVSAWLNLLNLTPVFGLDGAQATYALDRTGRGLVLATSLIFFGWLHEWTFLLIALGMAWRFFRSPDAPPSMRTLVRYVLLLFTLGLVILRFPDTTRAF